MDSAKLGDFEVKANINIYSESGYTVCKGCIVPKPCDEAALSAQLGDLPYKGYIGPAVIDERKVMIKTSLLVSGPSDNYFVTNIRPFDEGFYSVEFLDD